MRIQRRVARVSCNNKKLDKGIQYTHILSESDNFTSEQAQNHTGTQAVQEFEPTEMERYRDGITGTMG